MHTIPTPNHGTLILLLGIGALALYVASELVMRGAEQLLNRCALLLSQLLREGNRVQHMQGSMAVRGVVQGHALPGYGVLRPRHCHRGSLQPDLVAIQMLDLHEHAPPAAEL